MRFQNDFLSKNIKISNQRFLYIFYDIRSKLSWFS